MRLLIKYPPFAICAAMVSVFGSAAASVQKTNHLPKRVLVVTVTKGFRHGDSIPVIEKTVEDIGKQTGAWTTDFVRTDAEMQTKMTASALNNYDAIVFGSTTGDLPLPDREAFLAWIKNGHGFVGVHAASDTFYGFPAYLEMVGGTFEKHGKQVWAIDKPDDKTHAAATPFGSGRLVFDEIYEFKDFDKSKVHSLISMDKHPQTDAAGYYPVSWCKNYGTGRVFYTALGHRPDVWALPWFRLHVQNGILWTLGLASGDASLPAAK